MKGYSYTVHYTVFMIDKGCTVTVSPPPQVTRVWRLAADDEIMLLKWGIEAHAIKHRCNQLVWPAWLVLVVHLLGLDSPESWTTLKQPGAKLPLGPHACCRSAHTSRLGCHQIRKGAACVDDSPGTGSRLPHSWAMCSAGEREQLPDVLAFSQWHRCQIANFRVALLEPVQTWWTMR